MEATGHRFRGASHNTALGRLWWVPLFMTSVALFGFGVTLLPMEDFVLWGLEALLGAAEVTLLASWPIKRQRAGETLLRLSRTRAERMQIGFGVVLAVLGLREIIEGTDPVLGVLALLGVPIFTMAWFVGVQFTTKGILKFELLVPWSDTRSFEWSADEELELKLRLKRRYFDLTDLGPLLRRTATWSVAAEDREPLVELLGQHVDASLPGSGKENRHSA